MTSVSIKIVKEKSSFTKSARDGPDSGGGSSTSKVVSPPTRAPNQSPSLNESKPDVPKKKSADAASKLSTSVIRSSLTPLANPLSKSNNVGINDRKLYFELCLFSF